MKNKKKILIVILLILAAAGVVAAISGRDQEEELYEIRPTVGTANPGRGDIYLYTDLTGTVEPQSKASVMPKMGGEILEVYFQAGDYVQAGTALCKIHSDALTSLKLQVDATAITMNDANTNLARYQALFENGSISQQALEQAQNSAQSARIAYESAKTQYDLQVDYTTVTAPISGLVESRLIDPHDYVGTTSVICVISAKEQLQVNFGITEKTLHNLSIGDAVRIEKNGTDYEGVVTEVSSMVNQASGLYDIKALIPEAQGLTTGTRVKLTVLMSRAEDVMTVPLDVVRYDDRNPFVYCYENGIARKTYIEGGIYDSEAMEVKSGLSRDSVIITTWSNELADGEEVLLMEEAEPYPDEYSHNASITME